jgi:hypothetical protein
MNIKSNKELTTRHQIMQQPLLGGTLVKELSQTKILHYELWIVIRAFPIDLVTHNLAAERIGTELHKYCLLKKAHRTLHLPTRGLFRPTIK